MAELRRKVATFLGLPLFVIVWLAPAWLMLALGAAVIAFVPFRRLAGRLGENVGAHAVAPPAEPREKHYARLIGRTVALASRYAPFRSDCYPQALTAAMLCRLWRVRYALVFGFAFGEGDDANGHVWVLSGSIIMCGDRPNLASYHPVACFVSAR